LFNNVVLAAEVFQRRMMWGYYALWTGWDEDEAVKVLFQEFTGIN